MENLKKQEAKIEYGKCPIVGDTVILIDLIKHLPDNYNMTLRNNKFIRYEPKDGNGMPYLKRTSKNPQMDLSIIPIENGGELTRDEALKNLDNILL